ADRDDQVLLAHAVRERDVVDVEAVHDVEEVVGGEPFGDRLVDHRLHVRRDDRQGEAARPELDRRVAFGAALDAAFARQEQDVVVVEDFHAALAAKFYAAGRALPGRGLCRASSGGRAAGNGGAGSGISTACVPTSGAPMSYRPIDPRAARPMPA